jgi:hypothetical protein
VSLRAARVLTRIRRPFLLVALATMLTGCAAAAIMGMAPQVAEVAGIAVGGGVSKMEGKPDEFGPEGADEQTDRCEQLTRVTPGVEEVRESKDGSIESRQWRILRNPNHPSWMIAPTKTAPGPDGWEAEPEISRLEFEPPLTDSLKAGGDSMFIAYAPSDVKTPADSELFDSLTTAFGPAQGSFKWRQRTYDYSMVSKLPCFKLVKQ